MRRLIFGCLLLMMIVTGCNLKSEQTSEADGNDVNSPTTAPTDVLADCTPRTDWPIYVVQPGDNLTFIAQKTETTVDELVNANCLANPHDLQRGQELYVPVLPETQ